MKTTKAAGETQAGNYFVSNYPPYSCWKYEHVSTFLEALDRPPSDPGLSLYVHLPFCRQRCSYCYFRVYPQRSPEDIEAYLDAILTELSLYMRKPLLAGRTLGNAYFGGGSPSLLSPAQMHRLFQGLRKDLAWKDVHECTFECDPGTVTKEKLATLKSEGVSRLSLGFQSLNEDLLKIVGRNNSERDCRDAYSLARACGFRQINVDLLAGLPNESEQSWRETVQKTAGLRPDCISVYQLELTHNSRLYASLPLHPEWRLPTWEQKRRWVAQAFQMLEESGYTICSGYMAVLNPLAWRFEYTVENFWHGRELLALGESSFGYLNHFHYQNVDTYGAYLDSVRAGNLPVRRALPLRPKDRLHREVILQLKTGRLDAGYFSKKFGVDLWTHFKGPLEDLHKQGLLACNGKNVQLTRDALLKVDEFLPAFFQPQHLVDRYV